MNKIKIWGIAFFALLIFSMPGIIGDFKASDSLTKYSLIFGGALAFLFLPLYRRVLAKVTRNKTALKIAFPIGVLLFGYGAGVGSIGFTLNKIVGVENTTVQRIKSKGCAKRKCFCSTLIRVTTNSIMTNGSFCIDESLWNQVEVGQQLELVGVSSSLGFDINEIRTIR